MKTKPFLTISGSALALMLILAVNSTYLAAQTSTTKETVRLTRYEVKPNQQIAFRKAVSEYVAHALTQSGNILSEAFYEQDHPSIVWVIERWSNKTAWDKVSRSNLYKAISTLAQPVETLYAQDLEPLSRQQWRQVAKKEDRPIVIMLFVDSKPGTEGDFKKVYHTAMPQFRSEPGVINYQLSQIDGDGTRFVTYEKFRDEAAFQYHLKFPPIQPVIDYLNTDIRKQPFQDGLHRLVAFAPVDPQ